MMGVDSRYSPPAALFQGSKLQLGLLGVAAVGGGVAAGLVPDLNVAERIALGMGVTGIGAALSLVLQPRFGVKA